MLLFAAALWEINIWISMFMVLTTVSVFFPYLTRESHFSGLAVMQALLFFYFIVKCVKDPEILLSAICIIALVNVLFVILQFFDIDPLTKAKTGGPDIPVGLLTNRNEVSALLAFSVPAFFRDRWRWFIPLVLIGLVLTKSMGGIGAVAAGMIFYFGVHGYKFVPIATALTVLVVYAVIFDKNLFNAFTSRYEAIVTTLKYYSQHWLFGSGIGHFKVQMGKEFINHVPGKTWYAVHNEYVQGLFEMGVAFPLLVVGYFVGIYRRLDRLFLHLSPAVIPLTALVIIAINSMVHFPFHIAPTALIALTWLAILEIKLRPHEVLNGSYTKRQKPNS
jgi:hypothetical protein